jgi:hypothetical protein
MKLSLCAVMTQCCELAVNEKGKLRFVQTVSVCRLVSLTPAMKKDPDKLKSIRSNGDPRNQGGYKNYFYYGAGHGLGDEELMADFSQTACILSREFPDALANKIIQLDDVTRVKFKLKLGIFYSTVTDEEEKAGITDPWKEIEIVKTVLTPLGKTVGDKPGEIDVPSGPPSSDTHTAG